MKKYLLFLSLSLVVLFASGQTAMINGQQNSPSAVCAGSNLVLTASITGGFQIGDSLKWIQQINGATPVMVAHTLYVTPDLTVPCNPVTPFPSVPAVLGNYYDYTLIIKRGVNTFISWKHIIVNPLPIVTVAPLANDTVTVCNGTSTTLSTNTGSGYTYQWYSSPTVHPGTWTSISGATANTYATTTQAWYMVKVTLNGCVVNSNW